MQLIKSHLPITFKKSDFCIKIFLSMVLGRLVLLHSQGFFFNVFVSDIYFLGKDTDESCIGILNIFLIFCFLLLLDFLPSLFFFFMMLAILFLCIMYLKVSFVRLEELGRLSISVCYGNSVFHFYL